MLPNLKTFFRTGVLLLAGVLLEAAALDHVGPKFVLRDTFKTPHALADYRGKVVFINFWASWCSPCQVELPELDKLAAAYRGKKVQVLAINVDERQKAAKDLLRKLALSHPHLLVLMDNRSMVVRAYNIETMPTSYVLDKEGIIRYTHAGYRDEDPAAWRLEIDELLKK